MGLVGACEEFRRGQFAYALGCGNDSRSVLCLAPWFPHFEFDSSDFDLGMWQLGLECYFLIPCTALSAEIQSSEMVQNSEGFLAWRKDWFDTSGTFPVASVLPRTYISSRSQCESERLPAE